MRIECSNLGPGWVSDALPHAILAFGVCFTGGSFRTPLAAFGLGPFEVEAHRTVIVIVGGFLLKPAHFFLLTLSFFFFKKT